MTSNHIAEKVKVFISSKCDSQDDIKKGCVKYGVMRKSLKLLLEETNICNVYAFEDGYASTSTVVDSYMDRLEDADLIIIIVDNRDKISDPTYREINRAKNLNKRCLYIFCDEWEKEPTELQKELSNDKGPRYVVANLFSDIPEKAYCAAINDIIEIYRSYCRGHLRRTIDIPDEYTNDGQTELSAAEDCYIKKEYFAEFPYTKHIIMNEAGYSFGDVSPKDDRDYRCACLLGCIIGSSMTDVPILSDIKQDVRKMFKRNMQKLITCRYDAVDAYFQGDLLGCAKYLKHCLLLAETFKNIPKWIINDVALDLRNIQIDINRDRDIIDFHPQGQEVLEQDNEPLYYPVIDRILSEYRKDMIESSLRRRTQSATTISFGGLDSNFERISDAYIVAYYYGSITHMVLTRKRICDYTVSMALDMRDHGLFMLSIRMLLLSCDEKRLKQFINSYGENTNAISAYDMDNLLNALKKQPISNMQLLSRINALRFFGYYYSDTAFERELSDVVNEVKSKTIQKRATNVLVKPLIEAIKECVKRVDPGAAFGFADFIFENECKRYFDDTFSLLAIIPIRDEKVSEQKRYQRFIVDAIENDAIRDNCHNVFIAAQTLRMLELIDHTLLDEAVKRYAPKDYLDKYYLMISQCDPAVGLWYTDRLIEQIVNENNTQGKNGTIYGFATDPYLDVCIIVKTNRIKYDNKQFKRIISAIRDTILIRSQTIKAKSRGLELLIILQLNQPRNRQIRSLFQEIINSREDVYQAKDDFLMKGFSKITLSFLISILDMILNPDESSDLTMLLIAIQNSDPSEIITILREIEMMLDFDLDLIPRYTMDKIFQFVLNESYSTISVVRYWAMTALIKLRNKRSDELCMQRFVEMMDKESYTVKVGLLNSFDKNDLNNPTIQYIFDKGRTDTHYWVRSAACRFAG